MKIERQYYPITVRPDFTSMPLTNLLVAGEGITHPEVLRALKATEVRYVAFAEVPTEMDEHNEITVTEPLMMAVPVGTGEMTEYLNLAASAMLNMARVMSGHAPEPVYGTVLIIQRSDLNITEKEKNGQHKQAGDPVWANVVASVVPEGSKDIPVLDVPDLEKLWGGDVSR